MDLKVKILILGSLGAGKSTIADYLAGASKASGAYNPTMSVRILELSREVPLPGKPGESASVTVELWDCSGDKKREYVWPALQRGADGAVFVCAAGVRSSERELGEVWHSRFAAPLKLSDAQCAVFLHTKPAEGATTATTAVAGTAPGSGLGKTFAKVAQTATSIDENPDAIHDAFDALIERVVKAKLQKASRA